MVSYRIEWKNSAYKELQKLPRPIITKVVTAVADLSNNPYPSGLRNWLAQNAVIASALGIIALFTKLLKTN